MSREIIIRQPDTAAFEAALSPMEARVSSIVVRDVETHADAQELFREIRGMEKRVQDAFKESKESAFKTHRAITELEKNLLNPLERARRKLAAKMDEYEREQRRIAEEETRRREAEARRQEEERQLAEAQAAQDAGDTELAEAIINEPVASPAVVVAPEVAKVEGVSSRESWSAEVQNLGMLVKHCAESGQYELLVPNQTALNNLARALKASMRIPGVRAVSQTVRSARG